MEVDDHNIRVLVTQSGKGDASCFKKLYDHLIDKIYVYVSYRTSTKEQAIDLTQDVFIDLFTALSSFKYQSHAQFYAFVFVITRRKLAKHYTENNVKRSNKTEEFDENSMSDQSPDTLSTQATQLDVKAALELLDAQTREIVVLHHWARHTFGEIAQIMNMAESAVRVRHHRALKVLSTKLDN